MSNDRALSDIAAELKAIRKILERMTQSYIFKKESKEETDDGNYSE